MNLLKLKTHLQSGYTRLEVSTDTFRRTRVMPVKIKYREFYRQTKDRFLNLEQKTLPALLQKKRERIAETLSTIMEETVIPFWRQVRISTLRWYQYAHKLVRTLHREKLPLWFGDDLQQQLEAVVADTDKHVRKTNKQHVNRNIVVASISLVLALTGMLFSPPVGLLSVPGLLYVSIAIHKQTYRLLKLRKVSVETLTTLTILGCIAFGYFFLSCFVVLIFQLSRKLLIKVTENSRGKLLNAFTQTPQFVWTEVNGMDVEIPFHQVKSGDMIIANAGEMIPVDGVIVQGMASIDQHILTGEAVPVERGAGEKVFASTLIISGRIVIQVEYAGEETTVARIGKILEQTVDFKSTVELRAQTLANRTVMPTLITAAVAFPILGPYAALATINAHFKYRMAFIAPISILNFFNIASRHGILIKDGRSLDLLEQVDTIVFDKTGTLTEEQPSVGTIHICGTYTEEAVLRFAAATEARQAHPIARAIVQAAEERELELPAIAEASYTIGYGITVLIAGHTVQTGSSRFMEMSEVPLPPEMMVVQEACHLVGHSLVLVAVNQQLAGAIELIPTIRPEAQAVIHRLRQRKNITATYIISGDHDTPTRILAEKLGVDQYFAQTLPEEKAQIIQQLRAEGRYICYVGDGINDAIALKQSHVSISLSGASTVATDTAQIVLLDSGLAHLDFLFELAHRFQSNMNSIFALQVIPTMIGIGGVFLLGFGLAPTVALNVSGLFAGVLNAIFPFRQSAPEKKRLAGGAMEER